ncbi:MAG: hypothetical protein EHM35_08405 [Planctomycetaceae bacterium]|nr:MAG: hypothetical protein EHM35_08405 [Planctomycetaceae bacterium]
MDTNELRQLDARVAVEVMEWGITGWSGNAQRSLVTVNSIKKGSGCGVPAGVPRDYRFAHGDFPCYSTDIAAAWLVVEKLIAKGYEFTLEDDKQGFMCRFDWVSPVVVGWAGVEHAPTAPLAICRAALAAVGQGSTE